MKRYLWAVLDLLGCAAFLGSIIAFGFGKSSIEVTAKTEQPKQESLFGGEAA